MRTPPLPQCATPQKRLPRGVEGRPKGRAPPPAAEVASGPIKGVRRRSDRKGKLREGTEGEVNVGMDLPKRWPAWKYPWTSSHRAALNPDAPL